MRLPITPQISTKDGVSAKNARLTNCLKESKKGGDKAVVRPGLVLNAEASGVGNGLVAFNGELVSVYGATLGVSVVEGGGTPTLDQYTSMTTMLPQGLIYANSVYVCTGTNSSTGETRVYSSADGQTWSIGTITTVVGGFSAECIDWNGTTFCAMAMDDDLAVVESYTSTDGATWTKHDQAGTWVELLSNIGAGLVWDGTNFIFMSDKYVATSTNGVTFSETNPVTNSLALVWDMESVGGITIAVGDEGSSNNSVSVSSDGGATWAYSVPSDSGTYNFYSGICHDGSNFVIISSLGDYADPSVCTSANGTNFVEVATLPSFTNTYVGDPVALNRIAWNGEHYCATCPNGFWAISSDAVTWDEYEETGFAFAQIIGVTGGFLATATNGRTAVITVPSATGTIPTITTLTGTAFDFAQSPI